MPKGRCFAPSPGTDGVWFEHKSAEQRRHRDYSTSTSRMLSAPFHMEHREQTNPPLPLFSQKSDLNYKHTNQFSDHDNRHHFQDHGVYFGDGTASRNLGKRILSVPTRLHHTEKDFLMNYCQKPTTSDFNTTYDKTYQGEPTGEKPKYRRFPKTFSEEEQKKRNTLLDDKTFQWFKPHQEKFRTPTSVLAISQEPYLKHNAWKYSNNGLKGVYPPYDLKQTPNVNNVLNRYGAAYV